MSESKKSSVSQSKLGESFESAIETLIARSRWLLLPFFFGLVGILFILIYQFFGDFNRIIGLTMSNYHCVTEVDILKMIDSTLIAGLLLIVALCGYGSFFQSSITALARKTASR